MNDFNLGIVYAFKYIIDNMKGKVVNGAFDNAVTQEELAKMLREIPRKCDSCSKPCETSWCYTLEDKE